MQPIASCIAFSQESESLEIIVRVVWVSSHNTGDGVKPGRGQGQGRGHEG